MKIDNFALTNHQACPAKYDLRIRQGWQSRRRSGALGFGGAMHEGLAAWYKTSGSPQQRITAALTAINDAWDDSVPIDDYRTKEKCLQTMIEYAQTYPFENFRPVMLGEDPLIEVSFAQPLGLATTPCAEPVKCDCDTHSGTPNPECGYCEGTGFWVDEITYGGIFDGLVEFSGQLYVLEHKTTSQMGPMYFNQFRPNNQITGYIWGAGEMSGRRVSGAIVNAIKVTKTGKTEFKRQMVSRAPVEIDRWKLDVRDECDLIKRHYMTGRWPFRTNSCQQYGSCEFYDVHILAHPEEQRVRLETDYVLQPWNFERRDEPAKE